MQNNNSHINYVITNLKQSISESFGSRFLSSSHHLRTWLESVYVFEFYRKNKADLSYEECQKKCFPTIESICNEKGASISKENLITLVESKIRPTLS
jgi:hypothetical protein